MSAVAAIAREAAVALNEQATTEMETECEAVAAVSADAAVAREAAVALYNEQHCNRNGDTVRGSSSSGC